MLSIILTLWSTFFFWQDVHTTRFRITNISKTSGQLCFALYLSAGNFLNEQKADATMIIPVTGKDMQVEWKNISGKTGAIALFQDLNNNQRLDKNFIGLPVEPYGFSNNPKLLFGPPGFQKCAVDLTIKDFIIIELH